MHQRSLKRQMREKYLEQAFEAKWWEDMWVLLGMVEPQLRGSTVQKEPVAVLAVQHTGPQEGAETVADFRVDNEGVSKSRAGVSNGGTVRPGVRGERKNGGH